jgi:hypothetical protein
VSAKEGDVGDVVVKMNDAIRLDAMWGMCGGCYWRVGVEAAKKGAQRRQGQRTCKV